jgi:hypothetical protein
MSNHRLFLKNRFIISILITTFVFVLVIFGSVVSNNNGYIVVSHFIFSQPPYSHQIKSNITNSANMKDIATEKVHIEDIDIAYKIFGNGEPILLIGVFLPI